MQDSFALFESLYALDLFDRDAHPRWWPDDDDFRIVVEVILTQQTKWEKVLESIKHLQNMEMLSLEGIVEAEQYRLASAIVPSGFYNQKAQRLKALCRNIAEEFGDMATFKESVDREWLLRQKGIGMESADSILCYMAGRETMVVDSYTTRLLEAMGYTFETYEAIQEWLEEGILANETTLYARYPHINGLNTAYCIFHGLIVEYCKQHCTRSGVHIIFKENK